MRDYAKAERRADSVREALYGRPNEQVRAERAERYAGVMRIERGPAAFRVTFPQLSAHERGSVEAKAAWDMAREPMAEVKAIPGRTFDKMSAAWMVPNSERVAVEVMAEQYGATIEDATDPRIAELERQVAELQAELEIAYAHVCGQAVAA